MTAECTGAALFSGQLCYCLDSYFLQHYITLLEIQFHLSTYLLTPYKDHGELTPTQRRYNTKHSQTQVVIENAFGWLESWFRHLKYKDAEVENAEQILQACCFT